jgi:NADPH-dependent 2,4-dienoyl-CoA reductase/sulfur reductase-like enzyme
MNDDTLDLAVIGAGPAGMSAATKARELGLAVALIDEQPRLGGQIYRSIDSADEWASRILGADFVKGATLAKDFKRSGARHLTGATAWNVTRDGSIHYLQHGRSHALKAKYLIVATGAMERPFPVPGWTLPGVMGAGAAQIMLKTSRAVPTEGTVLAGCGPLLYLLATQYVRAGATIAALIDTTTTRDYLRTSSHVFGAILGWRDLWKGLGLLAAIRKAKIPFYSGASGIRVEGTDRAEAIIFNHGGRSVRIETPLVLLHQGIVPNTQISLALRAEHRWNPAQLCFEPVTDRYGRIPDSQVYLAGDGRGIAGAQASAVQGALGAIAVGAELGAVPDRNAAAAPLWRQLQKLTRSRSFLNALYQPKQENRVPAVADVVVCRCEEVTAAQIRGYVEAGCQGPNQTKAFGRCGMGPCQGRFCGLTVTELIADERGLPEDDIGYYRIRPPIKPIRLGQI